ncbi:MAG: glycosyl transferase [Anaerolineales bacterium]|nr:glycosyltransferase family 4 protein [Anaerolineae bacterium]PWB69606.1 MAG: glycosyl transferase [Anaerolineales bacterium]
MKSEPRIAFVIDALPSLGGGEKVLFAALEAFPDAELFTLVYNKNIFFNTPLAGRTIKTSFIDRLPLAHRHHRLFLPLMPRAIEGFDLREYETIVSFSYAVAHGVQNFNGARHLSYTYTPMRYAWTDTNLNGTRTRKNPAIDLFLQTFRKWDQRAASRVHRFAAISQAVSQRIADAYQRRSTVIYPPVDVRRFKPAQNRENFYITVTRLVPHKRLDIVVQAFSQLELPLLIVGEGPELPRLQNMAKPNIRFLGHQSDEIVAELLGKARGFVCATEEDFGIAIVEAQAAGCPVIAYGRGGALETVIDGTTGIFFQEQSPTGLSEAVQKFERFHSNFHIPDLVHNSNRFDKERFILEFRDFICPSEPSKNRP